MGVSSSNIPEQFILYPNYPNPFNPVTTIRYDLSKESFVDITIYDMLGNVVHNLLMLMNHLDTNQSNGTLPTTKENLFLRSLFKKIQVETLLIQRNDSS